MYTYKYIHKEITDVHFTKKKKKKYITTDCSLANDY